MDKKQANLAFHHSERLKSNLFLVSAALDRLTMLKAESKDKCDRRRAIWSRS